jgi:hypothetical protein
VTSYSSSASWRSSLRALGACEDAIDVSRRAIAIARDRGDDRREAGAAAAAVVVAIWLVTAALSVWIIYRLVA